MGSFAGPAPAASVYSYRTCKTCTERGTDRCAYRMVHGDAYVCDKVQYKDKRPPNTFGPGKLMLNPVGFGLPWKA